VPALARLMTSVFVQKKAILAALTLSLALVLVKHNVVFGPVLQMRASLLRSSSLGLSTRAPGANHGNRKLQPIFAS
jgi:hypothetical protein